jgi:hypothetical protein
MYKMYLILFSFSIGSVLLLFTCSPKTASNFDDKDNSLVKWVTVKEQDITFSIPDNLLKQDVKGRDNLYLKYSNEEISVSLESGVGSETLIDVSRADYVKKYEKKEIRNKDMKGVQVDYEYAEGKTRFDDKNKRYAKAVSFDCEQDSKSVTFIILFANLESSKIADKIIQSISLSCR